MLGLLEEHNKNICKGLGRKTDDIHASRGPTGSSFSTIDIVENVASKIDKTSDISRYRLGPGKFVVGVVDCKGFELAKKISDTLTKEYGIDCVIHNGKTILFHDD